MGVAARFEQYLVHRLEGPSGWLTKGRRTRIRWAGFLTAEGLLLFGGGGYVFWRYVDASLWAWSLWVVGGGLFLAYIWGLALNARRTARIAARVIMALPILVFAGFVVFLIVLYMAPPP